MNAYLIIYCNRSESIAIDETGAKARYQMYLQIVDIYGKKNASFADIRSRLIEKNVDAERTYAPISIEYTKYA